MSCLAERGDIMPKYPIQRGDEIRIPVIYLNGMPQSWRLVFCDMLVELDERFGHLINLGGNENGKLGAGHPGR